LARSCSTPELHPHPIDSWPKNVIGHHGRSYSQKPTLKATAVTDGYLNPFGTVAVQWQPASADSDCRNRGIPKPPSPGTLQMCGIDSFGEITAKIAKRAPRPFVSPYWTWGQPTRLWPTRPPPEQCAAYAAFLASQPFTKTATSSRQSYWTLRLWWACLVAVAGAM